MKKVVLTIAIAIGISNVFAQDLTSKKGEPILPETGDWAISFDAVPFLNYFGNLLNSGTNTSPGLNFIGNNQIITGKMYKTDKMAYRAKLRIGLNSEKNVALVNDVTSTSTPPAQVEDVEKISSNFIGLGAGVEMRRGKTRLQGYYGGEALIFMTGSKTKYEYGNTLTATNPFPTQSFGQTFGLTEQKNGTTIGVGVRGFLGVEYFILPKISLGAEYGWGITFSTTGEGTQTTETWNFGTGAAESIETKTGGGSNFSIDTDVNSTSNPSTGGSLFVIFHF